MINTKRLRLEVSKNRQKIIQIDDYENINSVNPL